MSPSPLRPVGLLSMLLGLASCVSLAPSAGAPDVVEAIPGQFARADGEAQISSVLWWQTFEDPILNKLVAEALAKNLDLAEASARLKAAEAQARVSKSGLFPAINASLNGSYSSTPSAGTGFGAAAGAFINRIEVENYSSNLGFSYELDIWGKIRNDARAGRADAAASAADLQAVRLAVLAETITSYFDLVDARDQITLTTQIVDVLQERVEQTETRFQRGLASSFELYQVRQDFRNVQAGLPQREIQRTAIEGQLAVLIGRYADKMSDLLDQKLQPRLNFDAVPVGLPIQLLAQRPDVRAEAQRLEARRFAVGARKADAFPALTINGATGTQAGTTGGIFDVADNWIGNLAGGLTAPLFQGGRIRANIKLARAQYEQQTAVYARTVLTAYQEVDVAIERYEEERQRYRFLFAQLTEARGATNLQSNRFESGVGNYVEYLDALRAQYQVQSALSSAGRDLALARLAIHRALGGDWADIAGPKKSSPGNAEISGVTPTEGN